MIRKLSVVVIAFLSALIFNACSLLVPSEVPQRTVTQVSTIDALLAGVYDGGIPLNDLLAFGNAGIGTFEALDGEMIILDGQVFQIRADGKVYRPSRNIKTPFASVVYFVPQRSFNISSPKTYAALKTELDKRIPNKNLFSAVCIKGVFKMMKTRSVPRQKKPYPPLAEVAKHQPVFEMEHVAGTVFGFRLPAYVKGINVPGYHLHFLSADLKKGGHILDFELDSGSVAIQDCDRFYMILPDNTAFAKVDLKKDRSKELRKVEQ